ncbi:MAG: S24 family peptidase, partial [Candidatus Omnitrophica bacterium]|nr:S24 family peptidase [Candidatus Omnitrophota bacterium]
TDEEGIITYPTQDTDAYAIRIDGDALKPRIKHGEFIIVEPNTKVESGDEVIIKSKDGRLLVRTFEYIRDGRLYYTSINENVLKAVISLEAIEGYFFIAAIVKAAQWYVAR